MIHSNWVFEDSPNTMVLTTRDVIFGLKPILFISHDADDCIWQFHYGGNVNLEDALLVGLKEIVDYDSSVTEIARLPLGWKATREHREAPWIMSEMST